MIKIKKGAVEMQGNIIELGADFSVIVTALIDNRGFNEALLKKCLDIGVRESGKSKSWEDVDDKD